MIRSALKRVGITAANAVTKQVKSGCPSGLYIDIQFRMVLKAEIDFWGISPCANV
jgi:hypothetical protein